MITKDRGPNPEGGLSTLADFGRKKYTCPKGHEWEAWGTLVYKLQGTDTVPLCPVCICKFLNANFPAKEVPSDPD